MGARHPHTEYAAKWSKGLCVPVPTDFHGSYKKGPPVIIGMCEGVLKNVGYSHELYRNSVSERIIGHVDITVSRHDGSARTFRYSYDDSLDGDPEIQNLRTSWLMIGSEVLVTEHFDGSCSLPYYQDAALPVFGTEKLYLDANEDGVYGCQRFLNFRGPRPPRN